MSESPPQGDASADPSGGSWRDSLARPPPARLIVLEGALAEEPAGVDRVELTYHLARTHLELGNKSQALKWALEAGKVASREGRVELSARAEMVTAQVFFLSGLLEEARALAERVMNRPGVSADTKMAARVNIASTYRSEGRLEEAAAAFDALAGEMRGATVERRASYLINAASCYQQVRRTADATEALQAARAALKGSGRADLLAWCDAIEAWVCLRTRRFARGKQLAVTALERAPEQGSMPLRGSAARALMALAMETADPASGLRAVRAIEALLGQLALDGPSREALDLHSSLATWHERQGDLAAAILHLRELQELQGRLQARSDQLRMERELMQGELIRVQLEADHVRIRNELVEQAHRALLASDQARSRLLATLAHDLRNALTNAVAQIEVARMADPDRAAEALEASLRALGQATAIVDQAQKGLTERGQRGADMAVQARLAVQNWAPMAARRTQTIRLEAPDEAPTAASPTDLDRLLGNLLSNAIKYGPEGGEIQVRVHADARRVKLTVLDQGPGFPGEDPTEALLFGQRLGAGRGSEADGQGIGLFGVYQLLAELGGVISIQNRPEGGAAVRISLPRG